MNLKIVINFNYLLSFLSLQSPSADKYYMFCSYTERSNVVKLIVIHSICILKSTKALSNLTNSQFFPPRDYFF
jgi:hypothetical protein